MVKPNDVYFTLATSDSRIGKYKYFTTTPWSIKNKTVNSYRVTLFNELFSEESCSVIGLSEKMGFQL